MRVAHFGDTHLGHESGRVLTAEGLNVRGEDIFEAFRRAIDLIVSLEPDLVIHGGDLWDSPRVTNRSMAVAVEGFRRIEAAGIPFLITSGNHDAPLYRGLGSPFLVFAQLGWSVVFQGRAERMRIGDVAITAIPHCLSEDAFQAELAKVVPDPHALNLFVTHGSWSSLPEFAHARGTPQRIPASLLDDARWDAIVLSHFHEALRLPSATLAYYAGSTERLNFAEVDHSPSIVLYDLAARTGAFHAIPGGRPMLDLGMDAGPMTPAELTDAIGAVVTLAIEPAAMAPIVRLRVRGVERPTWAHLDQRTIAELRRRTVQLEVEPVYVEADGETAEAPETVQPIGSLETEWRAHATAAEPALVALGAEYLRKVEP
jgi:hypothetical protein